MQPRAVGHTLVGESDAMRSLREQINLAARTPSNVLITGESGVGKELVAHAVHDEGVRHDAAFVAINCGAIPEALLESQLFGHLRGAFTTAVQANQGLFVAASQGTLFLDEIGEMPLPLQVKLLRVIEDKCVLPVGGTKAVPVDTRIIASTNRDLEREVEAGRFREDLFYRLNVVHLLVPPLRDRRGDIPVLVDHLVDRLNTKLGTHCLGVERDALWSLIGRPWKGNVRELENVLERAIVLGGGDLISLRDLSAEPVTGQGSPPQDLRGAVRRFERQHLKEVLATTQSDKRKAARMLGISLASLYRKLRGEEDEAPPAFSK
jgi:transcriptional regulator with PAS, ATPase and Fis domain